MKSSVFIATSMDGFISRKNGDIDWLNEANRLVTKGEDCGYHEFMDSVDVIVMGRNSFEKVLSFDQWPYNNKRVVVMTTKGVEVPAGLRKTVSCTLETPSDLLMRLSGEGVKSLHIDGGLTIQSFLTDGLIDELTITLIPVLLGEGKPLFGSIPEDIKLRHIDTKSYEFGFVQIKYQVIKS